MQGPSSTITIAPSCGPELSLHMTLLRLPSQEELRAFILLVAAWSSRPVGVVLFVEPGSVERCSDWVDALSCIEVGEVEVRFAPAPPEGRSA